MEGISLRLKINLKTSDPELRLPVQYNHYLQAALYAALHPEFAEFLHDQGFTGGGRVFKLFTFSRLLGRFQAETGVICFSGPVTLIVSSPVDQFCQELLNGLLTQSTLRVGPATFQVESVQVENPRVEGEQIRVRLLSPVVVYSTLLRPGGGKYTCYFQPGEEEFARVAGENLRKKWRALREEAPPEGELVVRSFYQPRLHILKYKEQSIKAYSGHLLLSGPGELLQVALDAGLGSKNSMGFGCVEGVGVHQLASSPVS